MAGSAAAGQAGGRDCDETASGRSGSYEVTARAASTPWCCTAWQTTDQQLGLPDLRGRSYAESGCQTAADILTVVRFNFPYVERGSGSPDSTPVLENTFKRVHDHVADEIAAPGAPIFIGGKSLGGRIAAELISLGEEGKGLAAAGLVELGYPLHRPGHKETLFTEPLRKIGVPSLFCIGGHDPFCDPDLLRPLLERLLHPGRLFIVAGGDHSLHRAGAGKGRAGGNDSAQNGADGGGANEFKDVLEEVARFVTEVARPPGL